jgi:hypothetical protein
VAYALTVPRQYFQRDLPLEVRLETNYTTSFDFDHCDFARNCNITKRLLYPLERYSVGFVFPRRRRCKSVVLILEPPDGQSTVTDLTGHCRGEPTFRHVIEKVPISPGTHIVFEIRI